MLSEEYWTLAGPGTAQTRVLGSRFWATALPVESEEAIHALLEQTRKEHFDASHHCWAFVLRVGDELVERSSDAGEPKGTAGIPILGEVKRCEIENCCVIVTRWFGGTKLGTGGLVRAYSEAASLALDQAPRVLRRTGVVFRVQVPFELQSHVFHIAGKLGGVVEISAQSDGMKMLVKLSRDKTETFVAQLHEQTAGRLTAQEVGTWSS
ncbi:MAG: YigZ family protein [Calditrichaeota bacterium]|nr:YigZ family protein [Calditrichota bacterium]MCB9391096.1 YigZ family protein [Calditrichota bacterium]